MDNARVVVGGRAPVVFPWIRSWRGRVQQKGGTVECSRQARDESCALSSGVRKWARAAAENVGCGRLRELPASAKVQDTVSDGTGNGAVGCLGVDRQRGAGVFGIYRVHVGLVIAVEQRWIRRMVGAQSAQVSAGPTRDDK